MDIKQDVLCDSKRGFDEVDGEEEEASKRVCSTTLDRSSTFASFTSSAADGSAEVDIERRDEAISPEVGGPPDEPLTEEHRLDTAEQKKELLNAKKEGDSAEEPTEEPLTEEHCLVKAEEEELPQKEGDSAAEPTEEPLAEEHCLVKAEEEEEKGLLNATPKMKGDSANGPLNSMQGVEFRAAFIDDLKFIPVKVREKRRRCDEAVGPTESYYVFCWTHGATGFSEMLIRELPLDVKRACKFEDKEKLTYKERHIKFEAMRDGEAREYSVFAKVEEGTSAASKSADCVTLNKEYTVVYDAKNNAELTYAILVKMYPSRVSAQYTFGKRMETFKNGLVLRQAS